MFLRPVTLIVLSVVILFGTVTTIFLSSNKGQVSVNPIAETAIPIPPVINLPDGLRVVLGEQQTLLNDKELGLRNMPGNGIAVIEYKPDLLRVMFAAGPNTYLVEGSDIKHLTSAHKVLEPGGAGAFDNCGVEVRSVVGLKGQLFAFYQAADCEDYQSTSRWESMDPTKALALLVSRHRQYFAQRRSDHQMCHAKRIRGFPKPRCRGIGQPGAVLDPSGRYIYLYYACYSGQKPVGTTQICMARSDISKGPPRPGNWEKLYNSSFSEPGLGGRELPVVHPDSSERVSCKFPHVLYSQALEKYILTFNMERSAESDNGSPPIKSGIYLALSDDGIKWSKPAKLANAYSLRMLGLSISIEATIILDSQDGFMVGWCTLILQNSQMELCLELCFIW